MNVAKPAARASALDRVRDIAERARAWVAERWHDFRRQSKFHQYRVYVVAAYVALAIVTIFVVMPKRHSNSIKAYVLAARGDFVVGSYILVRNDSRKDWNDVIVTVNGTHTFTAPALATGERLTVRLKALSGPAPLDEREVHDVTITSSAGSETYPVAFPERVLGKP